MANIGAPLWGDNRYGRGIPGQQIALWGYKLTFEHPTTHEKLTFHAMPEGGVWALYADLLTIPEDTKEPETLRDIRLSEDKTNKYPFVTYEMTVTPVRDKDGVAYYTGDTIIRVVGDDFETADTLRGTVETAVEGMAGTQYSVRLITSDKDCLNDIWTIELNYQLRQFS